MSEVAPADKQWMRRALCLARRAWGRTSPNPLVGAVLVQGERCVGEGYHHAAGLPHAEVNAIQAAGTEARGADLYVTLEPCSSHGRTPPCTDAIIEAGIRRVVMGSTDCNPAHAGKAIAVLRHHGIEVASGVLETECEALNESFFWWIRNRRPFVLLKMGMTLDGRIATAAGESKWITGAASRRTVQRLRQWADAIMVGGSTARKDDPQLTVRTPANWPRQPLPCVWTSRALPPELALSRKPDRGLIQIKPVSQAEWLEFLGDLGSRDITALLLEGGGELAAAALAAGIVNKVAFFVAPMILGGRSSRPVVGGSDPDRLAEAIALRDVRSRSVGEDTLITGYCRYVYGAD